MPRRVIYIKNPTRGSHFRTIEGGKTGGASGKVISLGPNLMDPIIEWMLRGGSNAPKKKAKKAKGIPYTPGIFIGTGGARYKTAGKNWFKAPLEPGVIPYGLSDMIEHLAALYEQQYTQDFQPALTILGALYDLSQGIDPNTGDIMPAFGTPGTLQFGAGTPYMAAQAELAASGFQLFPHDPLVFGSTAPNKARSGNPFPGRPGQYYAPGKAPNKPRPAWLIWYEAMQGIDTANQFGG